jgi:hypothetical protein
MVIMKRQINGDQQTRRRCQPRMRQRGQDDFEKRKRAQGEEDRGACDEVRACRARETVPSAFDGFEAFKDGFGAYHDFVGI